MTESGRPQFAYVFNMTDDNRCGMCKARHCFQCEHRPLHQFVPPPKPVVQKNDSFNKQQVHPTQNYNNNNKQVEEKPKKKKGGCC